MKTGRLPERINSNQWLNVDIRGDFTVVEAPNRFLGIRWTRSPQSDLLHVATILLEVEDQPASAPLMREMAVRLDKRAKNLWFLHDLFARFTGGATKSEYRRVANQLQRRATQIKNPAPQAAPPKAPVPTPPASPPQAPVPTPHAAPVTRSDMITASNGLYRYPADSKLSRNAKSVVDGMVSGSPNAYSARFGPGIHFDWWLFPWGLSSNRREFTLEVSDYAALLAVEVKPTASSGELEPISHLIANYTGRMAEMVTSGGPRPNQAEKDIVTKQADARAVKMLYSIACLLHAALEQETDDVAYLAQAAENVLILTENSRSRYARTDANLRQGNRAGWKQYWNVANGRELLQNLLAIA